MGFLVRNLEVVSQQILKTAMFSDVKKKKQQNKLTRQRIKKAESGIFLRTNSDIYKDNLCYSQTWCKWLPQEKGCSLSLGDRDRFQLQTFAWEQWVSVPSLEPPDTQQSFLQQPPRTEVVEVARRLFAKFINTSPTSSLLPLTSSPCQRSPLMGQFEDILTGPWNLTAFFTLKGWEVPI